MAVRLIDTCLPPRISRNDILWKKLTFMLLADHFFNAAYSRHTFYVSDNKKTNIRDETEI